MKFSLEILFLKQRNKLKKESEEDLFKLIFRLCKLNLGG
jgi:hypothetical protein